jgi:hypothetical protein
MRHLITQDFTEKRLTSIKRRNFHGGKEWKDFGCGKITLFAYMKSRDPDTDLNAVMNRLILYNRDRNRIENEFVTTVVTISKVSGKSVTSLLRSFSLLKLPEEIQTAVKEGTINVSQGYIFAANLDSPALM